MIVNLDEAIESAEFSGSSHPDPALIEYNSESPTQVAETTIKYCALTAKRHRDKLDDIYLFMTTRYLITLLKFRGFFFNLFWNIFPVCTGDKTGPVGSTLRHTHTHNKLSYLNVDTSTHWHRQKQNKLSYVNVRLD